MKLFLSIIIGTLIALLSLTPALGIDLLNGSKTQPVNRWPFSFGDRYIYDNTGSKWNYDYAYKYKPHRYLLEKRHTLYPHPRFKYFDKRLSLLGALCCLCSMLALDVWAGISAIAILLAIYNYLKRSAGPARWADSRRSFHLQQQCPALLLNHNVPDKEHNNSH